MIDIQEMTIRFIIRYKEKRLYTNAGIIGLITYLMLVIIFPFLYTIKTRSMFQIFKKLSITFFYQIFFVFLFSTYLCIRTGARKKKMDERHHELCRNSMKEMTMKENRYTMRIEETTICTFQRTHKFLHFDIIIIIDRWWGC